MMFRSSHVVLLAMMSTGTTLSAITDYNVKFRRQSMLKSLNVDIDTKVVRPELVEEVRKGAGYYTLGRDILNGEIRLINAELSDQIISNSVSKRTRRNSFIGIAVDFINSNQYFNHLENVAYILNEDRTYIGDEEQFLSFDVAYQNIYIEDAHLDFRFKYNKLVQVQNFTFSDADVSDYKELTKSQILRKAEKLFEVRPKYMRDLFRVIVDNKGYRLEKMVEYLVSDEPDLIVQMSYRDGNIYQIVSDRVHYQGQAQATVYQRSWFQAEDLWTSPLGFLNFSIERNQTGQTGIDGTFELTSAADVKMNGFSGKHVTIIPNKGSKVQLTAPISDDGALLNFPGLESSTTDAAGDRNMSQAMVYTHINNIIQSAQRYITANWFDRVLTVYVNRSEDATEKCNAYWSRTYRTITFFDASEECANTALISDVIYHEWGHGLDDSTGGIDDSAFSEGFGDIMSLVMNGVPEVGSGFFRDGKGIRDMSVPKVYPRDTSPGRPHSEGLIIGSTFFELLQELRNQYSEEEARDLLGKYAFKSILTARRYTDVYNALLVIDDDDANLTTLSKHQCLLNRVFTNHGLATKSSLCNG